jgi:flagellar hook-length control protein FliK
VELASVTAIKSAREDAADQDGEASDRPLVAHRNPEQAFSILPAQENSAGPRAGQEPAPHLDKPAPAAPAAPEEASAGQQKPVQSLQIRLDGPEPVQVQISQQAGNIHVSVRSGDPALTAPLHQNLPSLVENLERHGYHAESVSAGAPQTVVHSELTSQPQQNQSEYNSEHGRRERPNDDAKGRKKRTATTDFSVPFSQIQETYV